MDKNTRKYTQYKCCVLFHVGDINIFYNIYDEYRTFFMRDNLIIFITIHNIKYEPLIKNYIPNCIIEIIPNKGMDIGGFLKNTINVLKSEYYNDINFFYILHTKSNIEWRKKLLDAILINSEVLENKIYNESVPVIYGSGDYVYNNIKGINSSKMVNFYNRHQNIYKKYNINRVDEITKYFYKYIDDYYNINKNTFLLNDNYYKYIEQDLNKCSKTDIIKHYETVGRNEHHRIQTPELIKSNGINNYFIAGAIFLCNKMYFDYFKNFTFDELNKEFDILEDGYSENIIESNTRAWEYLFGLNNYLLNGKIITDTLKRQMFIYKQESLINIPINKAHGAIFLIIPADNKSGGYRTLLKYVEFLRKNNIQLDIYFGNEYKHITKDERGFSIVRQNIISVISAVNRYNELKINKYNYYIGLYVRRKYNFILSNAWNVADAVYENKNNCNNLGYIIQDLEFLFYNYIEPKRVIENTYKPDYKYYCLSSYLSNYFKKYSDNIYKSCLGIDTSIYYNTNTRREDAIMLAYYKNKRGRLPRLVENIIKVLVENKIKCYVFPDRYDDIKSEYLVNLNTLTPRELNNYYNKIKIGLVFSNTNPSRLGFEMCASGMKVIEYDSEFTNYDLPDDIFIKIKDDDNIVDIVKTTFNSNYTYNFDYVNSIDIKNELNNILSFIKLINTN